MSENYDAVVVGGGPAGSTAATIIAMRGHRVLLLEREHFPRYQIGESLLPSTVHGLCRILGVADEVGKAGFTVKRGGTFRWGRNPEPWQFLFGASPRVPKSMTTALQVERSRFDEILLRNASRNGVDVREGCRVRGVLTEDGRVNGVAYTDADGADREVRARYVVDASGNGSRIQASVGGNRVYSDFFRGLAVFGYFEGGQRFPAPDSGNILCAAFDAGWLWYIPLRDDLTSVGAVIAPEHAAEVQRDPRAAWLSMIEQCPQVSEKLTGVPTATESPYDEVRVRRDWSYWKNDLWTPGMVLVGDAACFVDPVMSSGVHLATYGALLAARSINACLDGDIDEARSFGEFSQRYRREYSVFYKFLVSLYDLQQDEKSYFWAAKKVTDVAGDELAAFVELVGGLVSADASVMPTPEDAAGLVAAATDLGNTVEKLGASDDPAQPLTSSPVIRETFAEGSNLLDNGTMNGARPVGPGDLVVAKDGLSWTLSEGS